MKTPHKFCLAVFLVAAFAPVSRTQSSSTVLDFEGYADSMPLTTQVSGAVFTNAIVLTSGVSLNEFEFPPHSGINVLSDSGGPISVSFTIPVKVVSGYFTYSTRLTVTAFDANNHQLAVATSQFSDNEALSGAVGSAANELITVSSATGISRVTFAGAPGGSSFALDDLTIMPPLVAPVAPTGPNPNPALTITSALTLNTVPLGSTITSTLTASGGYPPYTWSSQGAPAGITVTPGGIVTGKPTQAGSYRFIVMVTDQVGVTQGVYLNFSVFGITTSSLPDAIAYSGYSQTVAATGGAPPFSFSGSGFPGGISIGVNGTIAGIATKQGVYKLLIQATDANGLATPAVLSLMVDAPAALSVTSSVLPPGTAGLSYTQTLSASGGAPPYAWTLTGGALPAGLRLAASGNISGVPAAAGKFTFTVQAADSGGATASGVLSLTVAPSALTVNSAPVLPSGIVGVDYPVQIVTAAGGMPPYAYSVASGTLPPGLALGADGTIAGSPSAAGAYSFSVAAADSSGLSGSVSLSATVRPAASSLLLSAGSLVFSGVAGGAQLPAAQSVQVLSGAAGATVSWSASISPAVPWLSLSQASGTAPGAFSVTPTGQALSLAASSTPYQTAIVVACAAPLACSQTLSVSLTVSSPAPVLTSSAVVLSFAGSAAAPPQQQTLTLGNAGGGTIGFASIASPAPWVVVGPNPGSISAGQQTGIAVSVNAGGLAPGYYRSAVNVSSSAGVTSVPVTLFLTPQPSMALSAAGTQFAFSSGGAPAAVNHSFLISTTAASPIAWTASVSSGGAWLSTSTPSGSASASAPGVVSFSLDPAASAQLAPGGYYGTIRIASSAVVDSPLDFQVVLNVGPSSAAAAPVPSPEGLVFLTTAATQPAAQSVQVFSTGSGAANFQTSAITGDGHSWLSASPASFGTLPGAAAQSQISVNPAGLSPGVYYGTVNYAGPAATVRGVNVTMIVLPPGSSPCTPAQAIPVPLSLLNGFAATVSRPTPVAIMLLNDCGMPMTNGVATATFSDGETPLTLAPAIGAAGLYTATWYPRQPAAQASISLLAAAPGLAAAPVLLNGIVRPGNAPTLAPLSTLHIFAPQPGAAVAPGNIVQIYGSNLASSTASASGVPLATTLGGTSVSFGGIPAPLFYVSPSQINAQVPFELGSEGQYQIEVNSNGIQSPPDVVHVSATAPGIAALPSGIAIAQHSDGSLVSEQSPAKPGESLVLYASGLGVTNPAVASGAASPSSPLAVPQAMPTLLIGAESALIRFVGLTPGLVGLYQINMTVPPDVPNGDLPLVLSQGAGNSVAVILPVHN